jgi:uncharacterized membrane protein YdjX (TVP38/TMEM64 family)
MLPAMSPTQKRLVITFVILALAVGVGSFLRSELGIELDVESVRAFAESLGTAGPILFVFVVAGRALLALPSQIVLIAAGLCFGTAVGTVVGGAGLMLSGLAMFLIARFAGRESIEERIGERGRHLLDFARHRSGAVTFAIACGYPIMPLSPIQAGAGLTPMPISNFVVAAFIGGSIRSSIFAYFGNAIAIASWTNVIYSVAFFVAVIAIPLAFPKGRAWLREVIEPMRSSRNSNDS